MWKATGADQPAAALSASQRAPVFVYRFDWDEEPTILGAVPHIAGGVPLRAGSIGLISPTGLPSGSSTTA